MPLTKADAPPNTTLMRALVDACAIFPTVTREILLGVAEIGLFQPYWSQRILEEWARAAGKHSEADEVLARSEAVRLNARWPGAVAMVSAELSDQLYLPDPNDVHVLAAALDAECALIITQNLRDFPRQYLVEHGIRAVHPDAFLCELSDRDFASVETVAKAVRAEAERLSGQSWPMRTLLKKARLPRLGKRLQD